eukprot:1137577-Prymnesium_polylepis.1
MRRRRWRGSRLSFGGRRRRSWRRRRRRTLRRRRHSKSRWRARVVDWGRCVRVPWRPARPAEGGVRAACACV